MDNYEEKYKSALKWMQSLYDGLHGVTKEDAEHYFPELVEKDEKIKNEIIAFLYSKNGYMTPNEDWHFHNRWLVWLEKQGEQNFDYEHADIPQKDFAPIEQKFKVGDWITSIDDEGKVSTQKIIDFWGDKVRLVDLDEYFTLYPKSELNNYHLWTIQDAKDGDLIYVSTETKGLQAIFHKFENGIIYFHCNLCGDFAQGGYELSGDVKSVNPLLKEHYRRFFQKMKEAGYEWDIDKKELKKTYKTT